LFSRAIEYIMTPRLPRQVAMRKAKQKFPLNPKHPERICWGCDKYCPADALLCGNGSGRTEHPAEMLGEDWYTWEAWGMGPEAEPDQPNPASDTGEAVNTCPRPKSPPFPPARE
jgi:hypothetical protein